MSKITIMKGLPGSGKSTLAKELMGAGNTVRINKDLIRTMLHFDKANGRNEGHTYDASRFLAEYFLKKGINVIIDDTNLNPKTVQAWKDLAKTNNAKIEYADLTDVPVEECIARNSQRALPVKKSEIHKMAFQHLGYLKGQKVIIVDLDGTLCDCDHRRHYLQGEKKDWKGFFSEISKDPVKQWVHDQVLEYVAKDIPIVFVSARPENYRDETELWLGYNFQTPYISLIMRPANDSRPDTDVKSDIYEKYLKNLDIVTVFDDRPSIIRMWREKGLTVVDCGDGQEF